MLHLATFDVAKPCQGCTVLAKLRHSGPRTGTAKRRSDGLSAYHPIASNFLRRSKNHHVP
jgi:hypothetical protein